MSRKLPASERINHTLFAINYGAILMLLLPVLFDRGSHLQSNPLTPAGSASSPPPPLWAPRQAAYVISRSRRLTHDLCARENPDKLAGRQPSRYRRHRLYRQSLAVRSRVPAISDRAGAQPYENGKLPPPITLITSPDQLAAD